MVVFLIATNAALIVCLGLCLVRLDRIHRRYRNRGLWTWLPGHSPRIPSASLAELDPVFEPSARGVESNTEVLFIGAPARSGTDPLEAWILGVLAKKSKRMFEFGTYAGRTTYLWARNSPPEARITTLTLGPRERHSYQPGRDDASRDTEIALLESHHEEFVYTGTEVAHKIEQLFGDSKQLDEFGLGGEFDLIFIDGSHAYSYVLSDSRKALRMLRPGGLLLWHDYFGTYYVDGVARGLHELQRELSLKRIQGTSLVYYRKPVGAAGASLKAA